MTTTDETTEHFLGRFRDKLSDRGLKYTTQREAIASALLEGQGHFTLEQLLERAKELHPTVGYATVYRTMKLLTECGLAALRQFGDGQRVYELAADTAHHDHLICVECGKVLEFENEEIEQLQEKVARSFGFSLVRHKLELYGLCPKARGIRGGSCPRDAAEEAARNSN